MSPKWITFLIVGPIAVIAIATLLILRSVYPPPPKPMRVATVPATQPVADVSKQQPSAPAPTSVVDQVATWLQSGGSKYSISGYSWLNRNDGASEIQRGLHVQLLPATVPIVTINETLELRAKDLDKDYEREKKNIDDQKKIQSESFGRIDDIAAESFQRELDLANNMYRDPAARLRANESSQKGVYSTDDAYKFVKECTTDHSTPFIHAANAIKLKEEKTDVQGKFSIEGVPDGQYFLYACINTPALFVEWLVPVTVGGKDVSITLDNDNTSTIHTL